jgi:hypothetical protein
MVSMRHTKGLEPGGGADVQRFNFSLDDASVLDEIQSMTHRNSKAEVLRDAIALYRFLVTRVVRDGNNLYLGPNANEVKELAVTTLEAAKEARQYGSTKAAK